MSRKLPAFQFYTGDWQKDPALQATSMSTHGVWANMLCSMWNHNPQGELTGTFESFLRLVGCNGAELEGFFRENETHGFADVVCPGFAEYDPDRQGWDCKNPECPFGGGSRHTLSHACHARVTVINRRQRREVRERELTRKRQQRKRGHADVTQESRPGHADVTPLSSSSSSFSNTIPPTPLTPPELVTEVKDKAKKLTGESGWDTWIDQEIEKWGFNPVKAAVDDLEMALTADKEKSIKNRGKLLRWLIEEAGKHWRGS